MIIWVIDRIEGEIAVLQSDDLDGTFEVPVAALPVGVHEGDSLAIEAADSTERLSGIQRQIEALVAEDDGGDFSL